MRSSISCKIKIFLLFYLQGDVDMEEDWVKIFHDLTADIHLLHKTWKPNFKLFNICLVKGFVKWWFAWIRPLLCLNWQIWDTLSRLSWLLLCDQAIISENSEYISLSLVLNPVLFDMGFLFHSTCICTSVMTLAFNCTCLLKYTLSTKTDKREFF